MTALASSAAGTDDGALMTTAEFHGWWAERLAAGRFDVRRIPFSALDDWSFHPDTGNLGHASGRFFTIEGLRVRDGGADTWAQPIINQPEIGVLGIVVKRFDGVLHCLMQAKMEPGNVNTLQISPTVQATRSNYTRVHRGARPPYLDLFMGERRGKVLVDVLQSEQGAWFWRKRNRNMVVEVTGDLPVLEDFAWLTLAQIRELTRIENLVNMDARTVLSCLPFETPERPEPRDAFGEALLRSYRRPQDTLHTAGEALSWFTEAKTRCDWTARLVPLDSVKGWERGEYELSERDGRLFEIIAVEVAARTREVTRWTQPLLHPCGQGRAVFLARPVDGVLHLLVQARPEYGLVDLVEMAPTVHLPPGVEPQDVEDTFLRDILLSETGVTRYDTVLSEEGGRFYRALTRYQIVEVGDEIPIDVPPNFRWMTVRQLLDLLHHGHYLNIEARSLLACLHSLC
uniref:NDP-hexose 2,3-dehydratase family protein n=1 Tax=Herbidospora sakaeratensis TaxID=564415 RepID=UPI00078577FD|nr:NDP-hexose 2,3-dehydratase family protein [Herbidospora sakaeratensis]